MLKCSKKSAKRLASSARGLGIELGARMISLRLIDLVAWRDASYLMFGLSYVILCNCLLALF